MATGKWAKAYSCLVALNSGKATKASYWSISFVSTVPSRLPTHQIQVTITSPADDVVNTLISSLTTLSRTAKRPALGAMFLLNNLAYLRFRLLLEPRNASLPELLSRPTQDALQSGFRTAKAGYFDASFMPMMQTLSDDPKGNKAAVKEKFTRFFDLLEEVAERHRMGKMLEEDEDGRDTLAEEVVKLIVPSLQRFTQKNREKEFSKSASSLRLLCVLAILC